MITIEVNERQIVSGLNKQQKEVLMEYTKVPNPKYEQALKYSKWGAPSTIPKYLYFYDSKENDLILPRGVDVESILRVKCRYFYDTLEVNVKYPEFIPKLRKEQEKAANEYLVAYESRNPNKSVIHLPTGKGKTILALYLAQKLKMKTLVLVHKVDLLDGWKDDIKMCFKDKVTSGLIRGKSRKVGEQITLATVQTINKLSEEEFDDLTNEFGLVVCDEVHHVGANIFNIIDLFKAKYRLGLSATPDREDGLGCCLEFFLGGLCYIHEYSEDEEDICKVEVRLKKGMFKFKPIVVRENGSSNIYNYYDFKKLPKDWQFLEEIEYNMRPRLQTSVLDSLLTNDLQYRRQVLNDIYREYEEGHSILALFSQKEAIDLYYNSLKEYVPEDEIIRYYGDSKEDDNELRRKAESKEARITFATIAKATEGTNVKAWEVLFFVSSIASKKNVEQAIGRIRRKKEDKLEPVRVYDYQCNVYSLRNHIQPRLATYMKLRCNIVN